MGSGAQGDGAASGERSRIVTRCPLCVDWELVSSGIPSCSGALRERGLADDAGGGGVSNIRAQAAVSARPPRARIPPSTDPPTRSAMTPRSGCVLVPSARTGV